MCTEGGVEMKVEVCQKNHVQCFYVPVGKKHGKKRCPVCGSPTLSDCPECGRLIGRRVGCEFVAFVWERDLQMSRHCAGCGAALPWPMKGNRGANSRRAACARIFRRMGFKATYAAKIASGFVAGLVAAVCVLAGRESGVTASMGAADDGSYRITVGSSGLRVYMMPVGSRWICDCPDFEGGAARCGHVWAVALLGRVCPLARRLGLRREIRARAEKKTETAAAIERIVGKAVADPTGLEAAVQARINSAWRRYLEWEEFSNKDMGLSVDMVESCPGRAMHHAQQAMEKQIKGLKVYCAAFDDNFSPRKLKHDIFVTSDDKEFRGLLNKFRPELKELTMGVRNDRSRSKIMGYMGDTPSLVAYGIDIDEDSAPMQMENLTLERHYAYLQSSLAPPPYRPRELRCPTREYVSCSEWARFGYSHGSEEVALQWDIDATKILNEFVTGAWKWRYYALCVHVDARYPSEFDPVYRKNADIVRGWVFEAGRMTSHLQNKVRAYYANHTYKEGDTRNRSIGLVRDESWYENQIV